MRRDHQEGRGHQERRGDHQEERGDYQEGRGDHQEGRGAIRRGAGGEHEPMEQMCTCRASMCVGRVHADRHVRAGGQVRACGACG